MNFIEVDGIKTAYVDRGEGDALVLLHGLGGDHKEFDLFIPVFTRYFRVLAVDLPGHGQTMMPDKIYTPYDHAQHIISLLDKLRIRKVNVLGLSMGGAIAIELALNYPERIRKLILVSTSARIAKSPGESVIMRWIKAYEEGGWEAYFNEEIKSIFHPNFLKKNYEAIMKLKDAWKERKFDTIIWAVKGLENWDKTDKLSKINIPTLIIHGDSDMIIPVDEAKILHKKVSTSKLHIFEEAGHAAILEKYNQFIDITLKFLQGSECR